MLAVHRAADLDRRPGVPTGTHSLWSLASFWRARRARCHPLVPRVACWYAVELVSLLSLLFEPMKTVYIHVGP